MKIVYISAPFYADCDFPLLREWKKSGHEVVFFLTLPCFSLNSSIITIKKQKSKTEIFSAYEYEELKKFKEYLDIDEFYVLNQPEKSVLNYKNIMLQWKLLKMIDDIKPDVIFTPLIPDAIGCLIYRFRRKLVLLVHDPFPHTGESSFRDVFFRNIAFRLIPKFVILNKSQREDFVKYWKLSDSQVLNNRLGSYDCTKLFLPKEFPKQSGFNVLFYGRISPYKGIEFLCEAIVKVHNRFPDVTLTIAGSGAFYFDISPYEKLSYIEVENHYITNEHLSVLLYNCSVNVLPYTDATQSGVVLTSFAMRKPVIATNVGGISEYVEDGVTGILVPPKDVDALADAIISLLENRKFLCQMEDSIACQNDSYDSGWAGIAQKYIEFFSK